MGMMRQATDHSKHEKSKAEAEKNAASLKEQMRKKEEEAILKFLF